MNRRGFLRGAVGAAGAALGAFAVRNGVDARETAQAGVQGHQVDATTSMMTLATQGTNHYATPVDGTRTLIAGSFSGANWPADASMEAYCESFVNETIDRVFPAHVALRTPLIEPGQWLGEIRPITDAPAFLSEPL